MPASEKDLREAYGQIAYAILSADEWVNKSTKFWPGFKQLLAAATVGHAKDALEFNKPESEHEVQAADMRQRASEFLTWLARLQDDGNWKGYVMRARGKTLPGVWINITNTAKTTLFLEGFYRSCISQLNRIDTNHLDGKAYDALAAVRGHIEKGIPLVRAAVTAERFFGNHDLPDLT